MLSWRGCYLRGGVLYSRECVIFEGVCILRGGVLSSMGCVFFERVCYLRGGVLACVLYGYGRSKIKRGRGNAGMRYYMHRTCRSDRSRSRSSGS